MYTNAKDAKVCFFVANICFCHKSVFFRVAEVCFCLFFLRKSGLDLVCFFFKIRSVLIIGDTASASGLKVVTNLLVAKALIANAGALKSPRRVTMALYPTF